MIWKFNSNFEESKSNTIGTYKSIGRTDLYKSTKNNYIEEDTISSVNVSKTLDKIFSKLEIISNNMASMNQRLTNVENQMSDLYKTKSNEENFWHQMATNSFNKN
jgi:hypothetical protein